MNICCCFLTLTCQLLNHPHLSAHIDETDEDALSYMTDLEVGSVVFLQRLVIVYVWEKILTFPCDFLRSSLSRTTNWATGSASTSDGTLTSRITSS